MPSQLKTRSSISPKSCPSLRSWTRGLSPYRAKYLIFLNEFSLKGAPYTYYAEEPSQLFNRSTLQKKCLRIRASVPYAESSPLNNLATAHILFAKCILYAFHWHLSGYCTLIKEAGFGLKKA